MRAKEIETKIIESGPRLGVNIDHIATLRELRKTPYPNLIEAGQLAEKGGADLITVHLREDRRHIQEQDVKDLRKSLKVPLNLEMALADSIVRFAKKIRPDWACLVPEKRKEVTTEGGLNVAKKKKKLGQVIQNFHRAGIKVSLFVEPSKSAMKMAAELGADAVEIHTGKYALATQSRKSKKTIQKLLETIQNSGVLAQKLGLGVHAGHGLDLQNVRGVGGLLDSQGMPLIEEFNIGHSVVCRAAFVGLERAVREMNSAVKAP